MADYFIEDADATVICPYDQHHTVDKRRIQYHLMKCRKNYAGKLEYATCPYNASHEMPKPEKQHHMMVCPDRAIVEKNIMYENTKDSENVNLLKGCTDVPSYDTYHISSNENWDMEIPSAPRMGVHPDFFNKERRQLAGLTPLEKRQYHASLTPDVADMSYLNEVQEEGNYLPIGMTVEKKAKKVRRPKVKSQAETLHLEQNAELRKPKAPATVFQYSLAMAGVGRGRGVGMGNSTTPIPGISQPAGGIPASLQTYSMKRSVSPPSADIPPASIREFLTRNGKKTSSVSSSNSAKVDSNNEQFSDDENFDIPKSGPKVANEVTPPVKAQAPIGRGRGRVSKQNGSVFIPPMRNPAPATSIGRGARLQNGNFDPNPIKPNSWASMVERSEVNNIRDSPPIPDYPVHSLDDFPSLHTRDSPPIPDNPINSLVEFPSLHSGGNSNKIRPPPGFSSISCNNNINDGYTNGRLTPDNWFDCNDKENNKNEVINTNTNSCNEISESDKKMERNLRKKLQGITKLEEKQKKGIKLNSDELIKLSKKEEFVQQFAQLSL